MVARVSRQYFRFTLEQHGKPTVMARECGPPSWVLQTLSYFVIARFMRAAHGNLANKTAVGGPDKPGHDDLA
jgi:hypothetical protein